jgi:hypothetical protein
VKPARSWLRLRLQAVEVIGGLLRVAGGAENGPLIPFQHGEPALNIGGVIFSGLRGNAKIGTQEGRANLGNEFLHCVAGICKTLAA